jgi:hypothetical protein
MGGGTFTYTSFFSVGVGGGAFVTTVEYIRVIHTYVHTSHSREYIYELQSGMEGAVWILWSDLLGVIPDPIVRHARYAYRLRYPVMWLEE